MSNKKKGKSPKKNGKPPTSSTTLEITEAGKSNWLKKIIGTLGFFLILIIIYKILDLIPVSHRFSFEITSKGLNISIEKSTEQKPINITTHPFLTAITISGDRIKIATEEFLIKKTNEPELQESRDANTFKASSNNPTYYEIQNIERITIPTMISFHPEKDKPVIKFAFTEIKDKSVDILYIIPPSGKTSLTLATEETKLLINNSQMSYGTKKIDTGGKQVVIEGNPHKIKIEMESSKESGITFFIEKGKSCKIDFEKPMFQSITNLEFLESDPKSTIYREQEDPTPIKDRFPSNPNIKINGKIGEVREFQLTKDGIYTKMQGEYNQIQIAETVIENTALHELRRFVKRMPLIKEFLR